MKTQNETPFFESMNVPLMLPDFKGKNRIACAFREVARTVAKINNLSADVDEILFVIDQTTDKAARSASDISNISPMWQDVILQMTMRRFRFVIKFVNVNLESIAIKKNAFQTLIYHELRHIKKNYKTGALYLDKVHDIEDFSELVKFGDWENEAGASLPDLMNEAIARKELAELAKGGEK